MQTPETASREFFAQSRRSPREKISSWRVLARALIALAGGRGEDLLVKVQVLEGVAGVPPLSWSARPSAARAEIRKHLGDGAVELLAKGPNLYTEVRRQVERFVPRGVDLTVDDLMQQALMGLNHKNEPAGKPKFYAVGERLSKGKVLDGNIDWKRDVAGIATSFIKNQARDAVRRLQKTRTRMVSPTVRTDEGEQDRELPAFVDLSTEHQMALAINVLSDRANSRYRPIQDWMAKKVRQHGSRRPADAQVFEALLDNIERGSPKTETAIARELGVSGAHVSQAKKRIGKFLADELAKNPKVLDRIWQDVDLAGLGYGTSPLGRQARRIDLGQLVTRYLLACRSATRAP